MRPFLTFKMFKAVKKLIISSTSLILLGVNSFKLIGQMTALTSPKIKSKHEKLIEKGNWIFDHTS